MRHLQWRDARRHPARLGDVNIYYTYIFDTGATGGHIALAQKLLEKNIAETAISSLYGEPRVARRYSSLEKTKARASAWLRRSDYLDGKCDWSTLTVADRIFVVKLLVEARIKSFFKPHQTTGNSTPDSEILGMQRELHESLKGIDRSVRIRQTVIALQHALDRRHYEPGYLATEPFIRLELKHFSARLHEVNSEHESELLRPTVTLMLHSTGLALITCEIQLPSGFNANSLVEFFHSGNVEFSEVTFSEPVMSAMVDFRRARTKDLQGAWKEEIAEGARWREIIHKGDTSTLSDIFHLYQDAILKFSDSKDHYDDNLCIKTVHINDLRCCGSRRLWMTHHSKELASIISRSKLGSKLRSDQRDTLIGRDFSLTSNKSRYLTGGSLTEIAWNFDAAPDRSIGEFYSNITLVENGLVRYWILRMLNSQLDRTFGQRRKFDRFLTGAMAGIRLSSRSYFSYGSEREMSDFIVCEFGGDEILSSLNSRIALLQQLISIREAAKTSRRTIRLAVTAVLAAVALGLPAIKQSLQIIEGNPADSFVRRVLLDISGTSSIDTLSWTIYTTMIGFAIFISTLGSIVFYRSRVHTSRNKLGIRWNDGKMTVELISRDAQEKYEPNNLDS